MDYRKPGYDTDIARDNLERLLATAGSTAQREQWVRCLMDTAADAERKAGFGGVRAEDARGGAHADGGCHGAWAR